MLPWSATARPWSRRQPVVDPFAQIVVNVPAVSGVFDYALPPEWGEFARVGHLVTVPFGKQTVQGVILCRMAQPAVAEVKPAIDLLDPLPVLTSAQIELARWLSREYLASLAACIGLMLPVGLSQQADVLYKTIDNRRQTIDNSLSMVQRRLLDLLERRGFMGHHLALFDDLIHTPLIVRKPGLVPQGLRFDGFVQICDWFPTFLDLLDVNSDQLAAEMHGVSMRPTWRGEPTRDFILAEYQKGIQPIERVLRIAPDFDYRPWLRRIKAIRVGPYKYHWYSDGSDLLFDISTDPGERHNLIAGHPEIATPMRKRIESYLLSIKRHDFGDRLRNHGFRNVRWDNMARLSAMGAYRETEDTPE